MRADPHTIYYFVPTFKEAIFTSKHMECFNQEAMQATHPRNRKLWGRGTTIQEKTCAGADDVITQITLLDGVTAYRQGGWETDGSTPLNPRWAPDGGGASSGVRCRILTHGWVYCRWGCARKLNDGKAADDPKAHRQRCKDDGFVEFQEVKGVSKSNKKATPKRNKIPQSSQFCSTLR
jgi:hypothetical protein